MKKPCFAIYLLAIFVSSIIIFGFSIQVNGSNQKKPKSAAKVLQENISEDMVLIKQLAERPQLINLDYLECYLGPKTQSTFATSPLFQQTQMPANTTIWQNPASEHTQYKLETSQQNRNNCIAEFSTNIPDQAHRRLKEMDNILGQKAKLSFDQDAKPVYIYENISDKHPDAYSRNDTRILVYEAPRLLDIYEIKVIYTGPPLAPPTPSDRQEAMDHRRTLAFKYYEAGDYDQATSLLRAHLRDNPDDVEAHIKLAESYKAQCCLNESISEYRIALVKCGDNNDWRKRCLDGLHSLKVDIPKNNFSHSAGQFNSVEPDNPMSQSNPVSPFNPIPINSTNPLNQISPVSPAGAGLPNLNPTNYTSRLRRINPINFDSPAAPISPGIPADSTNPLNPFSQISPAAPAIINSGNPNGPLNPADVGF